MNIEGQIPNVFDVAVQRTRKPVDLKPTYPLDVDEVRAVEELLVCDSPKLLVWHLLAQLGSRFTLLSRFSESWASIEPQLSEAVVEHVVKQSNIAQNQVVRCLIDVLRDRKRNDYADTLTKFLQAKQTIEFALKTNRSLAGQRADVETIVDSIMQEVCNEIFLLADMEATISRCRKTGASKEQIEKLEAKINDSKERVSRAYQTLVETEKQTTFQQPPPSLETDEAAISESIFLDKLIDALCDENDFAKSINDRIREELPACE